MTGIGNYAPVTFPSEREKEKMKKLVSFLLIACMLLGLTACGTASAPATTPEPELTADDFVGVYIGNQGTGICLKSDGTAVYYGVVETATDENCTWVFDSENKTITVTCPSFGYEIYAYTDDGPSSLEFLSQDRSWINETFQKQNVDAEALSYEDYVRLINVLCSEDNSATHDFEMNGVTFQIPDYYGDPTDSESGKYMYADQHKGATGYAKMTFTSVDDTALTSEEWEAYVDSTEEEDDTYNMSSETGRPYVTSCDRVKNGDISYTVCYWDVPDENNGSYCYAEALMHAIDGQNLIYIQLECYEAFSEDYLAHFTDMLNTCHT